MAADPVFFRDLAYVFLAALLGGGVAWFARQPLILGYVVGGILISPLTPGPGVERVHTFELFAEIGVILLMFSIGIEFSLRDLLRVKWVALIGGPLGILLSVALALGVGSVLGWSPLFGLIIGVVVSVASTMVLARLLVDRGELHTQHGRVMIGITLVEDLAVVVLTRLLAIGAALGKALAILLPSGYIATKLVPPLMTRVARTRNAELFLLVALGVGLGTAALSQALGLSLALGAFLAGLVISESDYAHETLARLLPLRDAFVALFFVTLGALIDPRTLFDHLPLLGVMVGLIVVGKLVIWTVVTVLFGYAVWTAVLVGIGLTQIGEFSFILVQAARTAGHVGEDVYNATAITYPAAYRTAMKGETIKTILEDVADNSFNPDPYLQQGGDMVRVGGMGYTINVDGAMGSRIANLHMLSSGAPIEPDKEYIVAGWGSVNEGTQGPPIWDVVAAHLKGRQHLSPRPRKSVKFVRAGG